MSKTIVPENKLSKRYKYKGKPYSKLTGEQGQRAFRPNYNSSRELIYTLRKMYGLPLQTHTTLLPWGYDKLVEVEQYDPEEKKLITIRVALPNEDALKLLVQGKYLLVNTSLSKLGKWLGESLQLIGYDFSYIRNYNPEVGISAPSVDRLYKLYTPEDVCVLPIEDRYAAYRLRLESTDCNIEALRTARQVPSNITKSSRNRE